MRYSIESIERKHVKGYRFIIFAKNICKNFGNKYGQNLVDSAIKSAADALKTAG